MCQPSCVPAHPTGWRDSRGRSGVRQHRRRDDAVAIAAGYGITNLRVFGSIARGTDRPDSDVDLLVDLPDRISVFELGRLSGEVEQILGTHVDVVPDSDLKPGVKARVHREAVAL
jgi:predicted nucleotidyltransferase